MPFNSSRFVSESLVFSDAIGDGLNLLSGESARPASTLVVSRMNDERDYEYELFVSYAHADNTGENVGRVTAIVQAIQAEHLRRTGSQLRVFFDTAEIRTGDDWENRIKTGLRQSKLMLAIISPTYFRSSYCRREWEEYVRLEYDHCLLGEGIAPIYVISHSDFETYLSAPDDSCLKSLDSHLRSWFVNLKQRQVEPKWKVWWAEGPTALAREDARKRLIELSSLLSERVTRSRIRNSSPNNLPPHNPNFIGRVDELRQLNDNLNSGQISAIAAVNGIGGVGKTALALIYARAYGHLYPGGRFLIGCSTFTDPGQMQNAVVDLAPLIGVELTVAELQRPAFAFRKVKAAFEQGKPALLILDNLENPQLVGPLQRGECLPTQNTHILVTTRCEPARLGDIACESLDSLKLEDAQRLLFRYRPIDESAPDADQDWWAALEIARRLGGHALALEIVAVRMTLHRELTYSEVLAELETQGILPQLDEAGGEAAYTHRVRHAQTLVGPLLKPTLDSLNELEIASLRYAAFLPPDNVYWFWIVERLTLDFPENNDVTDPQVVPFLEIFDRLNGLRLLVQGEERGLGRCHRLVQEVVRATVSASDRKNIERQLLALASRAGAWCENETVDRIYPAERKALRDFAFQHLARPEIEYARLAGQVGKYAQSQGKVLDARRLYQSFYDRIGPLAAAQRGNIEYQSDLVGATMCLVDLDNSEGRIAEARALFDQCTPLVERLLRLRPDNDAVQSLAYMVFFRLGNYELQKGNQEAGREIHERCLQIAERLLAQKPQDDYAQHSVILSCCEIGDLELAAGRTAEARTFYERCQSVAEQRARDRPDLADRQTDLAACYIKLGQISQSQYRTAEAREYYSRSLEIHENLVEAFPGNVEFLRRRAMNSVTLADLVFDSGRFPEAQVLYERSLASLELVAREMPDDVVLQNGIRTTLERLGDLNFDAGRREEALAFLTRARDIGTSLTERLPDHISSQKDVLASLDRLGRLHLCEGRFAEALACYEECLKLLNQLGQVARDDPVVQQAVFRTLGGFAEVFLARGQLAEAGAYCTALLACADQRALEHPENLGVRHDQAIARLKSGDCSLRVGDLGLAKEHFNHYLAICERLVESAPGDLTMRRSLSVALAKLADVAARQGAAEEALAFCSRGLIISTELAAAQPDFALAQQNLVTFLVAYSQIIGEAGDDAAAMDALRTCYRTLLGMRHKQMPLNEQLQRINEWLEGLFGGQVEP